MISESHELITPSTTNDVVSVDIGTNVIGYSIEPAPNSDDSFRFGIRTEPQIPMSAGDGGRNYGFLVGPKDWEFCKPGQIKIKFDGIGSEPGVLVIFTVLQVDPNNDC